MSDGGESPTRRRRRSCATRGKLRRQHNIESVIVEETFSLALPANTPGNVRSELSVKHNEDHVGDGCYVSATVHNKRYYGVLVEQAALKAASLMHFQDESKSLDLNRRMKMLQDNVVVNDVANDVDSQQHPVGVPSTISGAETNERKRPCEDDVEEPSVKRIKVEKSDKGFAAANKVATMPRAVQKFRYVDGDSSIPGYRILLATYASVEAASEDEMSRAKQIEKVCLSGGGFVGRYYYQYEDVSNSLETSKLNKPTDVGSIRTSLGFDKFLNRTELPSWFPLRNLQTGQQKVLSMLKMKKGKGDSVVFDGNAEAIEIDDTGTHIPMEPRNQYRVGVLGAGIAGLACAAALLREAKSEGVDLEVVLLEGRSRVGGRLLTDETTFKCEDGVTPFPVDLGASWIHGIDHNPLAELAREAGVSFVTSSEEAKMLTEDMGTVDPLVDKTMGDLFDELLDQAADDCWEQEDFVPDAERSQRAVRWYASTLGPRSLEDKTTLTSESDAPPHRSSSDVSIDHAIGKAIAKKKRAEFTRMSKIERSLLLWNTKNIEYALGADINDLSMKFWDSDDRHAFEGDHVLLKEGYSRIVHHMLREVESMGDSFHLVLNFPVGKVEYARKSTAVPYPRRDSRGRKMVDLSDTCCVTSRDGSRSFKFDFLVSTLPLGILKESIQSDASSQRAVSFQPPLPFPKRDSISNVGFGLLNKVYLQFPTAFWRMSSVLPGGQVLFGNASGVNPEQYMFYDVGKSLGTESNSPAILMTLLSGKEAAACELLPDEALVDRVLQTLRVLFSHGRVPDPIASKVTKWGREMFSRGCYTFLPPGTSDQDFQILQSPINGNGDSILLDGSEIMRLFWAGEHTTALHPSMAHGAMLSGIRAAKEVVSTTKFGNVEDQRDVDKLIPLAVFRKRNPGMPLQCSLCNLYGSRATEGPLLAFQRGARQVLVHNNCAENSPEVEVHDSRWKNVIKAVNRGRQIECTLCSQPGATVGCTHHNCFKSFHYRCAEESGWRFERDSKVFYCYLHRSQASKALPSECDQLSLRFFRSQHPFLPLTCCLCGVDGDDERAGSLLIFRQRNKTFLVHQNCARFTTVVETLDEKEGAEDAFRNLLEAGALSKSCVKCKLGGATVGCSQPACPSHFHFVCAQDCGWKIGVPFRCGLNGCEKERVSSSGDTPAAFPSIEASTTSNASDKVLFDTTLAVNGASSLDSFGTTNSAKEVGAPAPSVSGAQTEHDIATILDDTSFANGNAEPKAVAPTGAIFQHNLFGTGSSTVMNRDGKNCNSHSHPSNAVLNGPALPRREKPNIASDRDTRGDSSSEDETEDDVMLRPLSGDALLPTTDRKKAVVNLRRSSVFDPWNVTFHVIQGTPPNLACALCIEVFEGGSDTIKDGDIVTAINNMNLGAAGATNLLEILALLRESTSLEVRVSRVANGEEKTCSEAGAMEE